MCFYHAYTHSCGHTTMTLAQLCPAGQLVQQKCHKGLDGVILATVKLETSCAGCEG